MKTIVPIVAVVMLPFAAPVHAIVGGAAPAAEDVGRSVVTIVGSRGNSCSGTLIAPDLVLSVAHCVGPGAIYKIVEYGRDRQPQLRDVRRVAAHPGFDIKTMLAHRATADVSLLQLETPKTNPSVIGVPTPPLAAGNHFTIAGIGVTIRGNGKSAGVVRSADLVATGHPGTLQIRLVDPAAGGTREGLGACTGDSGGPVFEDQHGKQVVVGIVDWSTGPNGSDGCGGLTGVTPLTLYRDWIVQTARRWGSTLVAP
ncbi:MAG: trypsin-like serine protease [Bradyrhizobium sp.]|uniref:S1 family peptidase n=1 Tax=Bradyrhizobium sp. TaxID=376 RepID=UPI001C29F3D2|nr:trypsin-like serine protease [Bradyrhizobium sp.]MBU6463568.1 trypsin-like serine protease [Pseudomonadota bacterium]MDE2067046.1 trypsin-like serine protease [Bradyrhizobium sp.]MDE2241224.1 trypsin-like serine protease [Bradyrhizobium sp.]MDE2468088.1 trypsin-like serine protease [Bradyrhizobium sp.]